MKGGGAGGGGGEGGAGGGGEGGGGEGRGGEGGGGEGGGGGRRALKFACITPPCSPMPIFFIQFFEKFI